MAILPVTPDLSNIPPEPPVVPPADQSNVVVDETQKIVDKDDQNLSTKDATNQIDKLLKTHNFDSLDDLNDSVESNKRLSEALEGHNIEELLENSKEMARINAYWAEEREKKTRESETESETINRLENTLEEERTTKTEAQVQQEEADEAGKVLKTFSNYTTSIIDDDPDIPDTHKEIMKLVCGVNNPMNEIDIRKKPDIKRMKKDNFKIVEKFAQKLIEAAIKNSDKIVPVGVATAQPSATGEIKAKNITEAGKMSLGPLTQFFASMTKKK